MNFQTFSARLPKIEEPPDFFQGRRLPRGVALPDNVLLFYHDFIAMKPNTHSRYTLLFPFAKMNYLVDRQSVALAPGEMLLILPHQVRYLQPASEGYGRLFITFELPGPQPYLPQTLPMPVAPAQWALLEAFVRAYRLGRTFDAVLKLVEILKLAAATRIADTTRRVSAVTAAAVALVNEQLNTPLPVVYLAKVLHVSESNLRLRFRRDIGQSIGRYITQHRLDAARYRLRATDMNISEVAESCGFESLFAFSHFFKNATGVSPLHYRQSARK